jgi:hypothetical protein
MFQFGIKRSAARSARKVRRICARGGQGLRGPALTRRVRSEALTGRARIPTALGELTRARTLLLAKKHWKKFAAGGILWLE